MDALLDSAAGRLMGWVGRKLDGIASFLVVKQHPYHLVLYQHVEIGMLPILEKGVEIRVGRILASTLGGHGPVPRPKAVVRFEILEVPNLGVFHGPASEEELIRQSLGSEPAVGYVHRPVEAMMLGVSQPMVRFDLSPSANHSHR